MQKVTEAQETFRFIKIYIDNKNILASGLVTAFLPEKLNEKCDKLRLIIKEKVGEIDSDRGDEGIVAINDNLGEYKENNPAHHSMILVNFNLL